MEKESDSGETILDANDDRRPSNRVGRGSNWGTNDDGCRIDFRDRTQPNERQLFFGFRIARTVR